MKVYAENRVGRSNASNQIIVTLKGVVAVQSFGRPFGIFSLFKKIFLHYSIKFSTLIHHSFPFHSLHPSIFFFISFFINFLSSFHSFSIYIPLFSISLTIALFSSPSLLPHRAEDQLPKQGDILTGGWQCSHQSAIHPPQPHALFWLPQFQP